MLRGDVNRIISLLPSATEWVCALGMGDALVGISHQCDYPATVADLPRVTRSLIDTRVSSQAIDREVRRHSDTQTSLYQLDSETIRRLNPDLILTQTVCNVCAVSYAELMDSVALLPGGCQVIDLRGQTLVDVLADARTIADLAGDSPTAARLIAALEQRIATVRDSAATDRRDTPRVTLLEWTDPLYCAGHWTPQLIEWAGGIDPIGAVGRRSRQIEMGELTQADPDILLVACCGLDASRGKRELDRLAKKPDWQRLRCVQQNNLHVFDGSAWFNRSGPRLVDALEAVAQIIRRWHDQTPPAPCRSMGGNL